MQLIEKSGLLTSSQVRKVEAKLNLDPRATAEATARRLVKERVLTPFQAERLLEGRYRGLVIDRYRIRELLGFGGMGCVFIAEDPDEDRKVAIKVMSAEHALDAGMLARLQLEGRAGMKLDHPNIIRSYRIDNTGAVHFLVMELVRGISLHELVALFGAIKWPMACDIIMQAAEALQYAHDRGIIHRDIKPANFLIESSGVTRILDFGLALLGDKSDEEFSLSMVFGHECLGTPDYISPEQSLDSRNVDARADIYSLGATFYVALTAHVPFPEKTNKAKLEAHRTKNPRSVCELRPDIPPEVGAIVARMMEKDPAKRYQSMRDVIMALSPYAKRKTIQFDFRELVTLRAKQAKAKAESTGRRSTAPKSSITSASGWIGKSSPQFSDATDSFGRAETPATRTLSGDSSKSGSLPTASSTAPIRPVTNRGPAPAGWRIAVKTKKQRIPLVKGRTSIGSGGGADIRVSEPGLDSIQCWLEHDGLLWHLRQESKQKPTFINGRLESYGELRHGSRLSFGGRETLTLVYLPREQLHRTRLIRLLVSMIILAIFGAGTWFLMRFLGYI
ncbi:MAG: FHA domain-containing serine/threonine-protein kinase [Planctomycetota bacterium]